MRSISANALTKLGTDQGTEPLLIIEIQWVEDGAFIAYAERQIDSSIKGSIEEIDDLDDLIEISKGATSAAISITLDDTDGSIKAIMDEHDVHKRPVKVYQWFDGLLLSEKFLLFSGEISSPLIWSEADRTIKFDVLTKIEDIEVGFSVDEGAFHGYPDELIGKPWPIIFGTCVNVPALKLSAPIEGILATPFGIHDFMLDEKEKWLPYPCPRTVIGWNWNITLQTAILEPVYITDPTCAFERCLETKFLELNLDEQKTFEVSQIKILRGETFPQNTQVTINVNDAILTGSFNGNIFTIASKKHPKQDEILARYDRDAQGRLLPMDDELDIGSLNCQGLTDAQCFEIRKCRPRIPSVDGITPRSRFELGSREGFSRDINAYHSLEEAGFFYANSGARVRLEGQEGYLYAASLVPLTTVHRVAAFRTPPEGGQRLLTSLPTDLYTVVQEDIGGYNVTMIKLTKLLSTLNNGWEDDLYVTATSSVGPNTVDIIEWLISTYTNFTTDATSFAAVKTKLTNYPSNFPLLERKNIIQVLEEIAFQARCAIYLKDGVFFLKYLSLEEASVDTIVEGDVENQSMEMQHTPTEDLVTKFVAKWHFDYAIEDDNTVILRHNVAKYGTIEREFDFYIYNDKGLVIKSATFWTIRMANTWKRAVFKTTLQKLALEPWDIVSVTFPDMATGTVKGMVEKALYNPTDHTIDFEIWLPVRAGSMVQYDFAWPSQISIEELFPQLEIDEFSGGSGSGPSFFSAPKINAELGSGSYCDGVCVSSLGADCSNPLVRGSSFSSECKGEDFGETTPSDLDDTPPSVDFDSSAVPPPTAGPSRTIIPYPDQFRQDAKIDSLEGRVNDLSGGGSGTSGNSSELPGPDDQGIPDPDDIDRTCTVEVRVTYANITQIRDSMGNFRTDAGATGPELISTETTKIRTVIFNSLSAAQAFFNTAFEAELNKQSSYTVGEEGILIAQIFTTNWTISCVEPTGGNLTDDEGNTVTDKDGNAFSQGNIVGYSEEAV